MTCSPIYALKRAIQVIAKVYKKPQSRGLWIRHKPWCICSSVRTKLKYDEVMGKWQVFLALLMRKAELCRADACKKKQEVNGLHTVAVVLPNPACDNVGEHSILVA